MRLLLQHLPKLIVFLSVCLYTPAMAADGAAASEGWRANISDEHPRLFFNKADLPALRQRAAGREKKSLRQMRERIDTIINRSIEFVNPRVLDGGQTSNHQYGFRAAEAALLYHLSGEEKYLTYAKYALAETAAYYLMRTEAGLNINWYAFSQISALCAYDWLYNDLSSVEREEIGGTLLKAIKGMMYDGSRKLFFRENNGGMEVGFYGPPVLPWYAGLAFYRSGIDDNLAEEMLDKGYNDHIALLRYRGAIAGDTGGAATACMGYAFMYYPLAEFNFLHTFQSATGIDISGQWDYLKGYLHYMDWNWLPKNREFGYGDVAHSSNKLPVMDMNLHLSELMHFYANDDPCLRALGERMLAKTRRRPVEMLPFIRLFISSPQTGVEKCADTDGDAHAMFFRNMGQVFMRSGVGERDTYALFSAGGILTAHKHFDNNNFVIYKNGYRALDSGTRPQPGLHLSHYFSRTVAHNCMLIEMPGEVMPEYWGGAALSENENEPIPNDGGQCQRLGSQVLAFRHTPDYVYIASDATDSYHKDKTSFVLREFLYILPDVFVIFDRVVSTDAGYRKTWLLHTAAEPEILDGGTFREESEGGKLICRTLLPRDAAVSKVGGPGRQFWSGGKNWPLPVLTPEDWNYAGRHRNPKDTHPMLGQWRVEVSPSRPQTEDYFLHLIQVGDSSLKSLPQARLTETEGEIKIDFEYGSKSYRIMFDTRSRYGGTMEISGGGKPFLKENLNQDAVDVIDR